jgi:hypothetical protein
VRFVELDALDGDALAALLAREQPALVAQCASLWSPWLLNGRTDPLANALRDGGFALQLPAQLPIIANVMRAARAVGLAAPVVNCSHPDVTHPVLARLELAPTIGIGNAGMILGLIQATLKLRDGVAPLVRVLAHHGHVTPVVRADGCDILPHPRVFLGEDGVPADALAFAGAPIPSTPELNALSAAHALLLVRALLSDGAPVRTSAPGPLGLPGGFPVAISSGRVVLDLPPGLALEDALQLQAASAALDGVAAIDNDGTVRFTEHARQAVAAVAPELAEPLHPADALARAAHLRARLEALR